MNVGEHVEGILLKIHDGLGQISAASRRGIQQYATLNNGHQAFHYVDGQGESNAPDIFLPGIRREEDVASSIRERSDQETAGTKRALQEEHCASTNETAQELLKKWRGPFMITEVHQQGRFYRLSTGRAAHYENLKPHVPSLEDWCIPQEMEGLEYLLVEPACEVNEKGTREKNDGNENLSLDDNEKIEADSEA